MLNYFGKELPPMTEILDDDQCSNYISLTLDRYLQSLGIDDACIHTLKVRILQIARSVNNPSRYEELVHNLLLQIASTENLKRTLFERAQRIGRQLVPHLKPGTVLDDGCGDGFVGKFIAEREHWVILADVYQHPDIILRGLPFKLFKERELLPFHSETFNNTILCTVLHHSVDPLLTLREALRVTEPGGRLLVTESVYGISPQDGKNAEGGGFLRAFLALDIERQFQVNMFFDHFYNRCFHFSDDPRRKITVPYNYQTPDGWKETFHQHGCEEIQRIQLGIDQPLAPLFHTLHIVNKV